MSKEKSNSIIYKNIYYILMYVIDELREVKLRDLGDEEFKALNDLYAAIINTSMLYVLNSGVLREYNLHNEITTRPKGRLEVAKSIIENKYQKGLILCKRFKLDINNEVNRVIKLAIRILLSYKDSIKDENLNKLKIILSFFNKVADVLPNEVDFRNIDTKDMSVEYKTAYFMSKLIISEYIMKEDGCNKD